jgi:predicted RNase H-like HicB family nuclease
MNIFSITPVSYVWRTSRSHSQEFADCTGGERAPYGSCRYRIAPRRLRLFVKNYDTVGESRTYSVVLEPDSDGGFTAFVPVLPGVVTEGETVAEALANAEDAIRLCLEDLHEQGTPIPASDTGARLERIHIAIGA